MTITPSYVGEPHCDGVIERFMRTPKEQCLYLHRFQKSRRGAPDHRRVHRHSRSTPEWLIEHLGHQTPAGARMAMLAG
jgi:hypothetical protein